MPADLLSQLQHSLGHSYRIERELGGGGMSRVFVAHDPALGRQVVVKLLPPELTGGVSVDRFRREIALAARLQHACIVPLLTAGAADGLPYFTMPLVEGESLRARLARGEPLPLEAALGIVRDVAEALSYAHAQGVVHRDIKPENILLAHHHALVTDFGVARAVRAAIGTSDTLITSHGLVVGTPAYMAPEQALGDEPPDERTDLYALGVVAYETITGRHPFAGRSGQALIAAHALEMPALPSTHRAGIPPALDALVMRLLEKDPARRPRGAEEVLALLAAIPPSAGAPVGAPPGRLVPAWLGWRGWRAARGWRRWPLPLGAIAVLGVTGGILVARDRAPAATAVASPPSVAVLPFANASRSPEDDYYSDGVSDALIGTLGSVRELRVAARSASVRYENTALSAREVGRRLRVGSVLEGSVSREGNRLRVMVQLIDTTDGLAIWSEVYQREARDIFAVQDSIARAIAGALQLRLSGGGPSPVQQANIAAYDLYLRGRYAYNKFTRPDLERAIAYFQQALAIDSAYAPAWAGIADAYISLADDWLPPRQAYPRARSAAARALALDSTLVSAHAALGTILMSYDWDFVGAEREFRTAIRLRPNDPWAYGQLATLLLRTSDRTSEALAQMERARLLDSLDVTYQAGYAAALLWLRRYDDAIRAGRRALVMQESGGIHIAVGDAQLASGDATGALRSFRRAEALGYVRAPEAIARASAALGDRATALRIAADLERAAGVRYQRAEYIARVWAALGERDRAFRWLDSALAERSAGMTWLRVHPAYDPLRGDPRLATLERRVGLR